MGYIELKREAPPAGGSPTGYDWWYVDPADGKLKKRDPAGATVVYTGGADMDAIEALSGTGLAVRTAADTWALRSLAAGSPHLSVANPAGVAGDPSITFDPTGHHLAGTLGTRPAAGTVGRFYFATDNGIYYRDTGAAWVPITAGKIPKTADETVNNSASFQSDDHLLFPVEANDRIFATLIFKANSASSASDLKFQWNVPAGATYGMQKGSPDAIGGAAGTTPAVLQTSTIAFGSANGGDWMGILYTWFTIGANAGTVTLQWAQNTATVEDTKLLTGSFLRLEKN